LKFEVLVLVSSYTADRCYVLYFHLLYVISMSTFVYYFPSEMLIVTSNPMLIFYAYG